MSDSQNNNIQNEINKTKAKILYEELLVKYSYIKDMDNEENIIKKIIELNFDENKIKDYYDVKELYNELEDEYVVSGFIEPETIMNKIRELHCDRELIDEWLENFLINGN